MFCNENKYRKGIKIMRKISKFGGSSVSCAKQIKKVKDIVLSDSTRNIIITSACGKENNEDNKITDLLYLCYAHLKYNTSCENIYKLITDKFVRIKNELNLTYEIEEKLNDLYLQLDKNIDEDYLVSRGEYFTAKLLSEYLGYQFIDATELIFFYNNGEIDYSKTEDHFNKIIEEHKNIVVPGFYGLLPNQTIRVMSRGGGDLTGSVIASVSNANIYENWTDVSGILTADPKVVDNPKQIETITYSELRELSYRGASVIHQDAIFPVREKNIPVHILNTNEPNTPGTIIVDKISQDNVKTEITGIAGKKDLSIITITKSYLNNKVQMINQALQILDKHKITIEHLPTGIDSFSMIVETLALKPVLFDVLLQLKESCNPDDISVIDEISLIATVSRFMKSKSGMSGRLFTTLGNHDINISTISQTSDEMNIIVGVNNSDYDKTIKAIYNEFVEKRGK